MRLGKRVLLAMAIAIISVGVIWNSFPSVRFLAGGAMVNLGYRFQDELEEFDFKTHRSVITPEQIWAQFLQQNSQSSLIRTEFPRSA